MGDMKHRGQGKELECTVFKELVLEERSWKNRL